MTIINGEINANLPNLKLKTYFEVEATISQSLTVWMIIHVNIYI